MFNFTLSKFRARLLGALGVLAAILMTNCCPPATLNGKIEKPNRPVVAAKSNIAAGKTPSLQDNTIVATDK